MKTPLYLSGLFLSLLLTAGCTAQATTSDLQAKIAAPLLAAAAQLQNGAKPEQYAEGPVRANQAGQLQVYVHMTEQTPERLAALTANGLDDLTPAPSLGVVQGWVAPQSLGKLAALPFVQRITAPAYAKPRRR